jgi:DMSO/TMAO reductase YedYZ molybdopterin-dependent catalytic subunit
MAGVLAGAAAIGAGQLAAGDIRPASSPIAQVGQLQIDHTPPWLKNFAIREFGSNDKRALVTGIVVVLGLFAAGLGVLALRRIVYGFAGLAVFTAVGLVAAVTRPTFTAKDAVPTLAAAAAGAAALWVLVKTASRPSSAAQAPPANTDSTKLAALDRRRFLVLSAGAAGATAVTVVVGGALADRFSVAGARARLFLPAPTRPARPVPAGAELHIPGLAPFVTPNSQFYRVDTAIVLPQIDPHHWRLRIHGMVDREVVVSFDDLLRLPLLEDDVTLCCVSNPVGGPYIGNARWLGASLAGVLRTAGIQAGADQLLCTSSDGFTSGTPVQAVMDGRDALLAIGMNGVPLPIDHGFPVRMVVPGLYGYVSATKWVTDIKVTSYRAETAYWSQRGWSQQAPIKTESRIDVPGGGSSVPAGPTTVAGVAWAQHKGVAAVEVSVDSGPWQPARLAAVPGIDTWRQWTWRWDATPGAHSLQARATDALGYTQTSVVAPPEPNGATGYPSIVVNVRNV